MVEHSDLEIVNEYLQWFIFEEAEREKKISDLFLQAFSFINDRSNWLAITVLAYYILVKKLCRT
jgi:ferritin